MAADRGPEPDEPGYEVSRVAAMTRHNVTLAAHNAFPMSNGVDLYVLCQCQLFKGTWQAHFEHCQSKVIDTPVRR